MDKTDQKTSATLDDAKGGLVFPTDFTLKVFGKEDGPFKQNVLTIFRQHVPHFSEEMIQERRSKDNNYLALSITIYAESREKLDAIYQDLTKCPDVLMAL